MQPEQHRSRTVTGSWGAAYQKPRVFATINNRKTGIFRTGPWAREPYVGPGRLVATECCRGRISKWEQRSPCTEKEPHPRSGGVAFDLR